MKHTSQGICEANAFDNSNLSTDTKVDFEVKVPLPKIASFGLTQVVVAPTRVATVVSPVITEKISVLASVDNPLANISTKQQTNTSLISTSPIFSDNTVNNPFQLSTSKSQVNETSSVSQINNHLNSIILSMNSNLEDLKSLQMKLNECLVDQLSEKTTRVICDQGISKSQSYEKSEDANTKSLKDEVEKKSYDATMAEFPKPVRTVSDSVEDVEIDYPSKFTWI